MSDLEATLEKLYSEFGPRKDMGNAALSTHLPHYFLLRKFRKDVDLLIILNTKRCRYQCDFCQLPAKSSRVWIPFEDIVKQCEYVFNELKHSLGIIERVTLSNEGSLFDKETLPFQMLLDIANALSRLPSMHTLVLESRLEFVTVSALEEIKLAAKNRIKLNILTGFETVTEEIRDKVLVKREPLYIFLNGLDKLAEAGADLTAYVLYKSSPLMSDAEAFAEADRSIEYLVRQCTQRGIDLTVRLNPMYMAEGSKWTKRAMAYPNYQPPRLTDIVQLADKYIQDGVKMYLGLSTEGLALQGGNYIYREDYSRELVKKVILFNTGKIGSLTTAI
jgi:radical SAM enzyme (TIGR01210 family)